MNWKGKAKGYVVLYDGMKEEKVWNYFKNMKKLIRFLKQMKRRNKDFNVYSCLNKKEMDTNQLKDFMDITNYKETKGCLQLDD